MREERARVRAAAARPLRHMSRLPPIPATVPWSKSPVGLGLLIPLPAAAVTPKRKTMLERIDGWWDLGLLEKGHTVSRNT
ncbi:hypothetical protein E4U55_004823 [Claviceps digitariae]|nr:hypothetical protein E4U55_004823 [Claviceps digitariae]